MEEIFGEYYLFYFFFEEMIEVVFDVFSLEIGFRERDWIFDFGVLVYFLEDKNLF